MTLLGNGMLVTFTQVDAADEEDFNEWYNREHMDERLSMAGFRRARRYAATGEGPRYMALYETDRVQDLALPAYLERLANQSPWSQRVMARFTIFQRLTLTIRVDRSHGWGGAVSMLRMRPPATRRDGFLDWLDATALPQAMARPGMLGGFVGENDLEVCHAPLRHQGQPVPEETEPECFVVLEGAEPEVTSAATAAVFTNAALAGHGIERATGGSYRLLMGVAR